jgi:hypothetical protein
MLRSPYGPFLGKIYFGLTSRIVLRMGGAAPALPILRPQRGESTTMSSTPRPVLLEVLAPMPTDFYHCLHCERMFDLAGLGASAHQQMQADYPPQMLEESQRLAAWLQDLSTRYRGRLQIRVLDPQSLQGLSKSLRYGVRRYPAFFINRRQKHVGWERAPLERALEKEIAAGNSGQDQDAGSAPWGKIRAWLRRAARAAGEILYGMTIFDWVRGVRRERGEIERLFVLVTFGDLVGLPFLPPYYTLRLLPYVVPTIQRWRRSLLRERDWTDLAELIEGVD